MPHFTQCLCFDLANTLPGHLKLPADFFQGSAISINQPKSLLEDLPLTICERFQDILDLFLQQDNRGHVARVFSSPVFNKIAKICFLALAYRRLKRDWLLSHLKNRAHSIHWKKDFFGHFLGSWF